MSYGRLSVFAKDQVTMMSSAPMEKCFPDSCLIQEVYLVSKFSDSSSSRSDDLIL